MGKVKDDFLFSVPGFPPVKISSVLQAHPATNHLVIQRANAMYTFSLNGQNIANIPARVAPGPFQRIQVVANNQSKGDHPPPSPLENLPCPVWYPS